jgi:hypothetical protein
LLFQPRICPILFFPTNFSNLIAFPPPLPFQIGNKYAELDGVAVEPIIVRFFGIFFLFFQFSSVFGNAISSAGLLDVLFQNYVRFRRKC